MMIQIKFTISFIFPFDFTNSIFFQLDKLSEAKFQSARRYASTSFKFIFYATSGFRGYRFDWKNVAIGVRKMKINVKLFDKDNHQKLKKKREKKHRLTKIN